MGDCTFISLHLSFVYSPYLIMPLILDLSDDEYDSDHDTVLSSDDSDNETSSTSDTSYASDTSEEFIYRFASPSNYQFLRFREYSGSALREDSMESPEATGRAVETDEEVSLHHHSSIQPYIRAEILATKYCKPHCSLR